MKHLDKARLVIAAELIAIAVLAIVLAVTS